MDPPADVCLCSWENSIEKENVPQWQQSGPCGSRRVAVVSVVMSLGTENRPLYGEMMQTLIPLALGKAILGHYELSHASPTVLRLVHLFVFYVFN